MCWYMNAKLANMHFVCGAAQGNEAAAQKMYWVAEIRKILNRFSTFKNSKICKEKIHLFKKIKKERKGNAANFWNNWLNGKKENALLP